MHVAVSSVVLYKICYWR